MSLEEQLEDLYNQAFVSINALRAFRGLPLEDVSDKLGELAEHVQDCIDEIDLEIEEDREDDYYDPSDEFDGSIVPPRDYS